MSAATHDADPPVADSEGPTPRDATPSVLAVVVSHAPGDWFEETLESLATQDYPRLEVLVVDAAGDPELGARVAAVLPRASVLDASDTDGFAAAADTVLDTGVDPAFLLFCHDDVALAPDAIRQLVIESLRSNAGITGPKLVDWSHPDRLQHVALVVDRFAATADVVDPGELDQEQYDAVGDVFAVPSACLMIRTGLFRTIGGFDPGITRRGDDVDLCWRAQLAGARVMVVPAARVRHRERMVDRTGVDDIRRTRARHQIRTVLVTASRPSLLVMVPLMGLLTVGEALIALLTGRLRHVRDVFGAWTWNLRRMGEIRARRRALRGVVRARHRDVRALQERGSVRINAFVRGQIGRRADDAEFGALLRTGTARISAIVGALVVLFVLFGSRTLVRDGIPAVGDFLDFGSSASALVDEWWSGWRHRDLGSPGSGLSGTGLLGALAWILGGSLGFVRLLWVVGPILVGLVGAWRMVLVTGSRRAQLGALVAYAIVPLPYNSVAAASIAGLYAYALAPWALTLLLHALAVSPFRTAAGPWRPVFRVGVALGSAVGVASWFDPGAALVLAPILAGLLVAGLVTGDPGSVPRLLGTLAIGAVVFAGLVLPQLVDQLAAGLSWAPFADGRSGAATDLRLVDIVGFGLGVRDVAPLGFALVAVMALPVLAGRSWRLGLAARGWFVALAAWGLAWAAAWGRLPFGLPDPALVIAPAAAGVALTAGAAVAVAEHDLRRVGFGWRQALLPVAVAGAVLATLPTLGLVESGRWGMPRGDFQGTVPFASAASEGSYRVLWLGAPADIPGGGRVLDDHTAWTLTLDGLPIVADRGVAADEGGAPLVGAVLDTARDGTTLRLGRTLGGLGVRYVVLLDRLAPAPFSPTGTPVDPSIAAALEAQLDLRRLEGVNSAMQVWENTEWTSVRAAVTPGFDDGRASVFDLATQPLSGSAGVLAGRGDRLAGPIPSEVEIYLAQTTDTGWKLEVDGERVGRRRSLGWATAYLPDGGGDAVLTYDAPWWRQGAMIVQIAVALVLAVAGFRRWIGVQR